MFSAPPENLSYGWNINLSSVLRCRALLTILDSALKPLLLHKLAKLGCFSSLSGDSYPTEYLDEVNRSLAMNFMTNFSLAVKQKELGN